MFSLTWIQCISLTWIQCISLTWIQGLTVFHVLSSSPDIVLVVYTELDNNSKSHFYSVAKTLHPFQSPRDHFSVNSQFYQLLCWVRSVCVRLQAPNLCTEGVCDYTHAQNMCTSLEAFKYDLQSCSYVYSIQ